MGTELVTLNEMERMANAFAKSRLFGITTPEQALSLMLIAQAEGYSPALAARDYHIINNKPTLKADTVLARFQQKGGTVEWVKYEDDIVIGKFSHPQGSSVTIEWTFEMAKKIGLTTKDVWKNYSRAMLRSRCISEGVRTIYPEVFCGVYTSEEVQSFAPEKTMGSIDASTGEVLQDTPVEEGKFSLFIPGNDDPYSRHHTIEDWTDSYAVMLNRIRDSDKYNEDEKNVKLSLFREVNKLVLDAMGVENSLEFLKRLSKRNEERVLNVE